MIERRAFSAEEEKFRVQRNIAYFLLLMFAGVTIASFIAGDEAERSTVLQTVINAAMIAIGWFGKSNSTTQITRPAAADPPETMELPK
jgi:hypothetical protein